MESLFEIKLFENNFGDCFILKLFCSKLGRYVNLLFDMGQGEDKFISEMGTDKLDGIIVTHVDRDHALGIVNLLRSDKFDAINNVSFIVFNAFDSALISYSDGNDLKKEVDKRNIRLVKSYSEDYSELNDILQSELPISFLSPYKRDMVPDEICNAGGIFITFLMPDEKALRSLMREWSKDNEKKGSGRTKRITNNSSVVCLVEVFDGSCKVALLLTGDGYIRKIEKKIDQKKEAWNLQKIHCIKLAHHGSADNNKGIAKLVSDYGCKRLFYMSMYNVSIKKTLSELPGSIKVIRGNSENLEPGTDGRFEIKNKFGIGG